MIHDWSIARKIALALALGPLALVVLGTVVLINTNRLLDAEGSLVHSLNVRITISSMSRALSAAESAERGYVLSGDDFYLPQFETAAGSISRHLDDLAHLTADNPTQQGRISSLRARVGDRVAEFRQAIASRRSRGLAAAIGDVRSERARNLNDQIASLVAAINTEEINLQAQRQAADQETAQGTLTTVVAGTILAVGALAVVGFFLIRSLNRPVQQAVSALASAASQILAGTTQQAAGVQEQAAAVAETVSTVEQIAQTAETSSDRARSVAETAQRAAENSSTGRRAVEDTVAVMADVKLRTESIATNILALAEQAQAIGEIIAVVTDVADQTNILALNAAIEASRAGEQGKGFAVVASEVKSLADQSKKATVQVRQILSEIQRATNTAVIATEQGAKTVDQALRSVNEADEAIRDLARAAVEAAEAAALISSSVTQQSLGIAQIRRAMRDINETTAQHLASTRQTEQAARNLDGLGLQLRQLLQGAEA